MYFSVLSLQELCCRAIVARTSVYGLERLPLPTTLKSHLKSYAISAAPSRHRARTTKHPHHARLNCTGRNSCNIAWNRMELLQYRLKSPGKPDGTLVISLETTWKDGWNSCIIAWNHLENRLELLRYWLKPPGKPDGTLALWLNHLENGIELLQYSLKPDETLVISLETIWKTGWKSCNIAWNRVDNIPNWRGMSFN